MNSEEDVLDFIKNGHQQYLPHLSIDPVIFGYHDQQLKILLLKWKGQNGWGLPGGFIKRREPLSEAAHRILQERTGLEDLFLQQFHIFGDSPYRLQERSVGEFKEKYGLDVDDDNWLFERTLSIGYFALVDYSKVNVRTDFFTEDYEWWDVNAIPRLLFDHNEAVEKALVTLRLQIYHQPIGYNLLPEKFTLPEIHSLYETILGKELDQRNFSKKLVALGLIKKLNEQRSIGPHRSPYLYQFEKEAYEDALKQGIVHTY
ncbi:NUDIX hydrolase [Spirosoma sp. KCTC 42546]|uniref:NUDIX hydrolase n=1 Tax=Spirosoma sp. KCTC 42546 TaxID=2520506 RepID=UPI0011587BCB|nr:NUDIX domain-containing protein [Spirosoma sp. KCTC 42546]QDK78744.1 NUDIX hydrolase [Spirosoma sp. KCTC 42546]